VLTYSHREAKSWTTLFVEEVTLPRVIPTLPFLCPLQPSALSEPPSSWVTLAMSMDWRTTLDLAKLRVYVFAFVVFSNRLKVLTFRFK
jgi:hypothetical protein